LRDAFRPNEKKAVTKFARESAGKAEGRAMKKSILLLALTMGGALILASCADQGSSATTSPTRGAGNAAETGTNHMGGVGAGVGGGGNIPIGGGH
jgi:hypothetical protein